MNKAFFCISLNTHLVSALASQLQRCTLCYTVSRNV